MTTITKNMKKYRSYDQYQLKELSDTVCDNIEELLNVLGIEDYRILDKMVMMSCPIHGGDNNSAFNLYYTGDNYRGNWKCRTHQCEETFRSSIIGFIRGCLSKSEMNWTKPGDDMVSFNDAIEFAIKFSKHDPSKNKLNRKEKEKNSFVNTINYITSSTIKTPNAVPRQKVISSLSIPSKYFLDRNYTPEILTKYDIGDCLNVNREMFNRAVVPIYDTDHENMVGCSGRTIVNAIPKWKHNDGFKAEEHLYNYWYAKDYIRNSGVVILVESPGNVWRLEEAGIHNSLAIFGSSLKDKQKLLLDISGAMTIITLMDNDEAGKKASQQIHNKCHRTYNIRNIELSDYADIGDMPTEMVIERIKPIIEQYTLC